MATFITCTVPSSLPKAMRSPLGDHATAFTDLVEKKVVPRGNGGRGILEEPNDGCRRGAGKLITLLPKKPSTAPSPTKLRLSRNLRREGRNWRKRRLNQRPFNQRYLNQVDICC